MPEIRRKRNENGESVYYNINNDQLMGDGIISSIGSKIMNTLTGKTVKHLASKATEKLVEKGSEKVGSKLGEIVRLGENGAPITFCY